MVNFYPLNYRWQYSILHIINCNILSFKLLMAIFYPSHSRTNILTHILLSSIRHPFPPPVLHPPSSRNVFIGRFFVNRRLVSSLTQGENHPYFTAVSFQSYSGGHHQYFTSLSFQSYSGGHHPYFTSLSFQSYSGGHHPYFTSVSFRSHSGGELSMLHFG